MGQITYNSKFISQNLKDILTDLKTTDVFFSPNDTFGASANDVVNDIVDVDDDFTGHEPEESSQIRFDANHLREVHGKSFKHF